MANEEKTLHELFDIGILLRGMHAILEIIGGMFTFLISPNFVLKTITHITQGELLEDPRDYFSQLLINIAHSYSVGTKQLIAFYLLSHGIVNLILVIGLFKKKMWAYHTSFIALSVFTFYQMYRYIHRPNLWMIILTMFDIVVIWLIWKEYKKLTTKK